MLDLSPRVSTHSDPHGWYVLIRAWCYLASSWQCSFQWYMHMSPSLSHDVLFFLSASQLVLHPPCPP